MFRTAGSPQPGLSPGGRGSAARGAHAGSARHGARSVGAGSVLRDAMETSRSQLLQCVSALGRVPRWFFFFFFAIKKMLWKCLHNFKKKKCLSLYSYLSIKFLSLETWEYFQFRCCLTSEHLIRSYRCPQSTPSIGR